MIEEIEQEDLNNVADVIWWIKGYIAGAKDNFNECPFSSCHIESLRKFRANELEQMKDAK